MLVSMHVHDLMAYERVNSAADAYQELTAFIWKVIAEDQYVSMYH